MPKTLADDLTSFFSKPEIAEESLGSILLCSCHPIVSFILFFVEVEAVDPGIAFS